MNRRIEGNERDIMLDILKAKHKDGYTKEQILRHIEKEFGVRYAVGTYKVLYKEATYGRQLQKRQVPYEEYMEKCKAEYNAKDTSDPLNSKEAERLFAIANGEVDIDE